MCPLSNLCGGNAIGQGCHVHACRLHVGSLSSATLGALTPLESADTTYDGQIYSRVHCPDRENINNEASS